MKRALRIGLGVLAAVLAWQLAHAARSAWSEYSVLHPPRSTPVMPADAAGRALRNVSFAGDAGTTIHGWYITSVTGAAVVLAGGSEADRTAMWPYAKILSDAGIGVLMFDWPGTGESGGRVRMGAPERIALHNGVSFVLAQHDVTDGRVGLLGFSLGSYVGVLEAAQDRRVRVMLLEGLFDNPIRQTWTEYATASTGTRVGGVIGDYVGGLRPDDARVRELLPTLQLSMLVLVAGDADRSVPIAVTRELFAIARPPKEFWQIHGAAHGYYLSADSTYGRRVRLFFERALRAAEVPAATR